jgi:hypothetical protein
MPRQAGSCLSCQTLGAIVHMQPSQQLSQQAATIQATVRAAGGALQLPPAVLYVSLAQFFNYNVTKGGFAQLIYNAQGEYLQEIEHALSAASAESARSFYEQAIHLCFADVAAYQEFIASPFTFESSLKHSLQVLSIEYLRSTPSFEEEAATFIAASEKIVKDWSERHAQNGA